MTDRHCLTGNICVRGNELGPSMPVAIKLNFKMVGRKAGLAELARVVAASPGFDNPHGTKQTKPST